MITLAIAVLAFFAGAYAIAVIIGSYVTEMPAIRFLCLTCQHNVDFEESE